MFSVKFSLVGDDLPTFVTALAKFLHLGVFDYGRPTFFGSPGISMHGSGGVDIALPVAPESAKDAADVHNGTFVLDILRRHQVAVFDPDCLKDSVRRLQPFPTCRRRGDCNASGHAKADILAGFGLDLG